MKPIALNTTTKQNVGIVLTTALLVALAMVAMGVDRVRAADSSTVRQALESAEAPRTGLSSYLSSALNSGMHARNTAQSYSNVMQERNDPRLVKQLRDAIDKATGSF